MSKDAHERDLATMGQDIVSLKTEVDWVRCCLARFGHQWYPERFCSIMFVLGAGTMLAAGWGLFGIAGLSGLWYTSRRFYYQPHWAKFLESFEQRSQSIRGDIFDKERHISHSKDGREITYFISFRYQFKGTFFEVRRISCPLSVYNNEVVDMLVFEEEESLPASGIARFQLHEMQVSAEFAKLFWHLLLGCSGLAAYFWPVWALWAREGILSSPWIMVPLALLALVGAPVMVLPQTIIHLQTRLRGDQKSFLTNCRNAISEVSPATETDTESSTSRNEDPLSHA